MKYLHYISYLLRHKWFVLIECWKRGLYWRGIVHDASKLRPSEFFPYVNFFFGKDGRADEVRRQRKKTGYYKATDTGDDAFDFAWLLHQKRNRHHWQFWILPEDEGSVKVLPMPLVDRLEMISDWIGAGRAQGYITNTREWWEMNKSKMTFHPDTRTWIENELQRKTYTPEKTL